MTRLKEVYANFFQDAKRAEKAFASLNYFTDLAQAVKDAELVVEAVPERIEIKQSFYKDLAKVAPEKTVFASNSSTLLPSQFAD